MQSSFNFCPSSKWKLSVTLILPFCTQFHFFALGFTFLHSISLFCSDLGLIDMLLTNQNAEIVACILLYISGIITITILSRINYYHTIH